MMTAEVLRTAPQRVKKKSLEEGALSFLNDSQTSCWNLILTLQSAFTSSVNSKILVDNKLQWS